MHETDKVLNLNPWKPTLFNASTDPHQQLHLGQYATLRVYSHGRKSGITEYTLDPLHAYGL